MVKPYYKKSHKAYYANIQGKTVRLGVTKDEAERAFRSYRDLTSAATVIERFLKSKSPETRAIYEKHLTGLPAKVKSIQPFHLDGASRNKIIAAKTCFKWAAKKGYIPNNPFQSVEVPKAKSRPEQFVTPEQCQKIFEQDGEVVAYLRIIRQTGCRPRELRQVEARHLNDKCWVFAAEESKGKKTPRVVHLTAEVYHACQLQASKNPVGPLFPIGSAKRFSRLCLRLSRKVGFRVTPYTMRHVFATEAIVRNVDLQTIATWMGHTDLRMLNKVYQHVHRRSSYLQEQLQRIAQGF